MNVGKSFFMTQVSGVDKKYVHKKFGKFSRNLQMLNCCNNFKEHGTKWRDHIFSVFYVPSLCEGLR